MDIKSVEYYDNLENWISELEYYLHGPYFYYMDYEHVEYYYNSGCTPYAAYQDYSNNTKL